MHYLTDRNLFIKYINENYFKYSILIVIFSCNIRSDLHNKYGQNKLYYLQLNPYSNSKYHYDITNESEVQLESNEQKIDNLNKVTLGLYYSIVQDSSLNYLFKQSFDKIKIYTTNEGRETTIDADESNPLTPQEKVLASLKGTEFTSLITQTGEIISVSGSKELANKVFEQFPNTDSNTRNLLENMLHNQIENEMIRKNMDQLFKIFPDSAVHIGDKWKLNTQQKGTLNLNIESFYTLKDINNDIALIQSHSTIRSDKNPIDYFSEIVTSDLNGEQEGEFEIETKTGMIINNHIKAKIHGTLNMMGKELTVSIKMETKTTGRKIL